MKMDEDSLKFSLRIKMFVVIVTIVIHLLLIFKLLKGVQPNYIRV